jgi:hypothetical protein
MMASRDWDETRWVTFSALWLLVAGAFNLVFGATAIHRAPFAAAATLFWGAGGWGWVAVGIGIVQLAAGILVFRDHPAGRPLGIAVAATVAFVWCFLVFAVPVGALVAVLINALVVYGLTIRARPAYA